MEKQTIDNYRFASMEEPSDEILSQLMHEVAEEAREKGEEANKRYFTQLKKDAAIQYKKWFENNPNTTNQ